jgi:hypothetical protein
MEITIMATGIIMETGETREMIKPNTTLMITTHNNIPGTATKLTMAILGTGHIASTVLLDAR